MLSRRGAAVSITRDSFRRIATKVNDVARGLGPAPEVGTGVFVLGMHRSGTSALARIVNLLGIPMGKADDLLLADAANPRGYWESGNLSTFQEHLLGLLGGSWDEPPALPIGWEQNARLSSAVGRGRQLFRQIYGDLRLWAWKDPRNSLTLPFWRYALDVRALAIIIYRHPLEVSSSLSSRDDLGKGQALALWERYNRQLLENVIGLPALVVAYEDLISDPHQVAEAAQAFLLGNGIALGTFEAGEVDTFIDSRLRHSVFSTADLERDAEVTATQLRTMRQLQSLKGAHMSLELQ